MIGRTPLIVGALSKVQMADTVNSRETRLGQMRSKLRELYEGETQDAHRFRYSLLAFDVVTIAFIVATSFAERTPLIKTTDISSG